MTRQLGAVALFLTVVLAGCSGGGDATPDLMTIFGSGNVDGNGTVIKNTSLEGRIHFGDGESTDWDNRSSTYTLQAPVQAMNKPATGPEGGGGATVSLALPHEALTLEVRLIRGANLTGYTARWTVLASSPAFNATEFDANRTTLPANESFTMELHEVGRYLLLAEISAPGRTVASTEQVYAATLNAHWTVTSAVRPVRPPNTPPPQNYDEMADEFNFPVGSGSGTLTVMTQFRGTYTDGQDGTNIDLGLYDPDGTTIECGTAGGARAPSTADARETITVDLNDVATPTGNWLARVGAMEESADCGTGWSYTNSGDVPYTLDVRLTFSGEDTMMAS